jgi:predicted nucleic acid-binding protein
VHAPHLIDVEVAQVIRRYARLGEIDAERGRTALVDLNDFPPATLSACPALVAPLGDASHADGL